jgi:hypothetical protein
MNAGHGRGRTAATSGIENNGTSHPRSVLRRGRRRYPAWNAEATDGVAEA